jgi:hypothetical protein
VTNTTGASVWEQEIHDHVSGHVVTEGAILDTYQRLAEDPSGSPAFRYLADLILADERRHHQLFNDLAESIRQSAQLRDDEPIPSLHGLKADPERIMATTEQLLETERADARDLMLTLCGAITQSRTRSTLTGPRSSTPPKSSSGTISTRPCRTATSLSTRAGYGPQDRVG